MELVIIKKNLVRALGRTYAVADRKSSMPILSNVLVTTQDTGTLRFAGTDLYLGVSATASCEVKKGGSVAVAAKMLFDIAKNLPEGDVTWSVGPNHPSRLPYTSTSARPTTTGETDRGRSMRALRTRRPGNW